MFANVDYFMELADHQPFITTVRLAAKAQSCEGGRNDKLKSMVAASLNAGKTINECVGTLIRYDQEKHVIPLFSDESEAQMRGSDVQSNALSFVTSVMRSVNQRRQADGLDAQSFALDRAFKNNRPEGSKIFVSASTLLENVTPPVYLVNKVIEEDTDAMIFGPSGEGKTFVALDIGCAVATGGQTLMGHSCDQGIVLYLNGEGNGGIRKRIMAWANQLGKTSDDLKYFQISDITVNFDGSGLEEVAAEAKELAELHGVPVKLIIIDTLARHMDGDENSTKDAGNYIRSLGDLRQQLPKCSSLTIHHTGNNQDSKGRARGSSAVPAAMDCIIKCNSGTLTFTKMKDDEVPQAIDFKLMKVEIGTCDNNPITSCYVEYGAKATKNKNAELGKYEKIVIDILEVTKGRMPIDDLHEAFIRARNTANPAVNKTTVKRSLTRAIEFLVGKQMIIPASGQYLLSSHINSF